MPRNLTSNQANALVSSHIIMGLMADLEFANSVVHVWSGAGNLVWNSNTYCGVGTLGTVQGISEDSEVAAKGVQVSLSGIPSTLVQDTLYETRLLKNANIQMALFYPNLTIIDNPILSYQGRMDATQFTVDGKTATITINLENVLVDLNRMCYRRYTDPDQQIDLAATLTRLDLNANTIDTGFTHVPGNQSVIPFWGTTAPS